MPHLTLLITLLTLVYSWEQIKEAAAILFSKLFKRYKTPRDYAQIDGLVGTILIVATLPMTLAYWIMDQGLGTDKLLILAVQLMMTGLLLSALEIFQTRKMRGQTTNVMNLALGLVARPLSVFLKPTHDRKIIAHLAMTASLPLLMAIILKTATRTANLDLNAYLDRLTMVAMLGLGLLLSIELMEKLFRTKNLHLSAYLRIVLGIVLITILAGPK